MIPLTIAVGRYDRTAPLLDGRVRAEGLDITWLPLSPDQIFWRMLRHGEFDASEISLSSLLVRLGRNQHDLIPLPVFLSRSFRHSSIYVNARAGIDRAEDLIGRRIGVPEYQMTAAVWARGIIEDEFGVRPEDVEWLQGGLEQTGRLPQEPVSPPGVRLTFAPPGRTLSDMLASGDLDALFSPRAPSTFDGSGRVKRLFDPPWDVERQYYRRTRIFPIMHAVAIKRSLVDRMPWIPQTLATAFLEAKRMAEEALHQVSVIPIMLPFLGQHVEETSALMGKDFWPYGLEANRATLDAFIRYSHRQGLIPEVPVLDEIFPASTVSVSRR